MAQVPIDITNPADIRRQLPAVRELRAAKIRETQEALEEVQALGKLIESLEAMVGTEDAIQSANTTSRSRTAPRGKAPARQTAIEALRQAGRPMGPRDLYRFMQENDMPVPANANALGATLWTAAKAGAIDKVDRRYFARPMTDYAKAAEMGLPVPGHSDLPSIEGNPGR
jgi:hypothetical protein